jgi:threonine dehydrogenase-like Zn-dependent dehydrogenase
MKGDMRRDRANYHLIQQFRVMITDVSDFRLSIAARCGIDRCVNSLKEDLSEAILEFFGSEKADGILECVGMEPTMDQAIRNARKGTDIVVVGVFGEKGSSGQPDQQAFSGFRVSGGLRVHRTRTRQVHENNDRLSGLK